MEIFEKIGEVASQTYKFTTEKADKIAKETKLRIKINENKAKIEALYNEIGETAYRRYISQSKEEFDEEINNACEQIDKISKEIEQQNQELLSLKDRKQCPNCHEKIEKEANYCSNCGQEQIRIEENSKDEKMEDEQNIPEKKEEKQENEKEICNNPIEVSATEEEKASNDENE